MPNQFLTNYTDVTFLEKIKENLRHCTAFCFSVSFIKIYFTAQKQPLLLLLQERFFAGFF